MRVGVTIPGHEIVSGRARSVGEMTVSPTQFGQGEPGLPALPAPLLDRLR